MDDEAPHAPRRRSALIAVVAALAVAAVPAGVALAGSGGQSSGSEGQVPDAATIQDRGQGDRNGDRDGHDCPKDRQGESSDTTAL
jgi:hypothetical protein